MKNKLLTLAGALALLAVLGHYYAKPLLAQVRAALVQNVDEPGRNPIPLGFQTVTGTNFTNFSVPAGKRYVIEAFTGSCILDSASSVTAINFTAFNPASGATFGEVYAQAFRTVISTGGAGSWAASATTRLYVNPGSTIIILPITSGPPIQQCDLTVSGYVINLP